MNKAITDGIVFMPSPFAEGLDQWSRGNGTPGSPTYDGAPDATLVPFDSDFGTALELLKTEATQRLRHMGQTPLLPGCYLRLTLRVKAISGPLPSVRLAAYAATAGGAQVTGIDTTGPAIALTDYGVPVELSVIFGSGARPGVDWVWGMAPAYGHVGLDLLGDNGGVVRVEDVRVEDVTSVFHRKLMDWVDVRDYGATGDGVTDDTAAFLAADAAAADRVLLVSEGTYRVAGSITLQSRVRFTGKIISPPASLFILMKGFDLATYIDAFGDEVLAFKKAFQALLNFSDHDSLDLCGRRIDITEPIDMQAALANKTEFAVRRVIRNGQFSVADSPAWADEVQTSTATYSAAQPTTLTSVANVASIPVGALVTGNGVGREVYVRARNVGAGTITLSQPLFGAAGTQTYTFRRFKYVLDFSGFSILRRMTLSDVDFFCQGFASAVMLPPEGSEFHLRDCTINRPKDRGVTSIGRGCQDLFLDRNLFISNEMPLPATERTTIAFNVNANDSKIRNNRGVRFRHFAVVNGMMHMFLGNHFFQGDETTEGVRLAGLILTEPNCLTTITGNYIDNCFIEWNNEHDAEPDFGVELSFGGLTLTGNIFTAINVAPWHRWLRIAPYGAGHFVNGLTITGNAFKPVVSPPMERIEAVDTSRATLDFGRMRNIVVDANSFHNITQRTQNPVVIRHDQNTEAATWVVSSENFLPFGGRARTVVSVTPEGAITDAAGAAVFDLPYALIEQGPGQDAIHLNWSRPVKGRVRVVIRMDNPL